jgi:hypothetical protein
MVLEIFWGFQGLRDLSGGFRVLGFQGFRGFRVLGFRA